MLKKWIERILIGLLGMAMGLTISIICHQKELWLWDIPRMTEENELAIQRIDQDLPRLQELSVKLKLLYQQIQNDWGRILELQNIPEEIEVLPDTGEENERH